MKILKWMMTTILVANSIVVYASDTTIKYSPQSVIVTTPPKDTAQLLQEASLPDTSAFWYFIREAKGTKAQQEFIRLKELNPSWQPEQSMNHALDSLIIPKASITKKVIPRKSTSMYSIIAKKDNEGWRKLSNSFYLKAYHEAMSANDLGHLKLMGWVSISKEKYQLAINAFAKAQKKAPNDKSAKQGTSNALTGLTNLLVKANDIHALSTLIAQNPEHNIIKDIESKAWDTYNEHSYEQSLNWFEFTSNTRGQVYSLDKLDHKEKAAKLACANSSDPKLLDYCVNDYAAQQYSFYQNNQFEKSIHVANIIQKYKPLSIDQLKLFAWSSYQLNHKQQSATAFTKLIKEDPDNKEYAKVLVNLYENDQHQLNQLSKQYSNVLLENNKQSKSLALSRKQFDRYNGIDNEEALEEQITIETGIDYWAQNSGDALANLKTFDYFVGITKYWNQYRFGARIYYETVDSDEPVINDDFWQERLSEPFDLLTDTKGTQLGLYAKRQFKNVNTLATANYWQSTDGLPSILTGKLSAVWFAPKFVAAGTLYRDRLEDSLLSYTGAFGNETETWGGVTANGIKGLFAYSFQPNWSISTELDGALITGKQVENNTKLALQISVTNDFTKFNDTYLDYLRLGPTLSWFKYNKNLNYYTQGNGGYFSPENYVSVGGKIDLLTTERKQWQVRSQLNLGIYQVTAGDVDKFPLSNSSSLISQESTNGLGGQFMVEGQWLLTPHLTLAGLISTTHAVNYSRSQISLNLHWHFFKKKHVTSDGLISSSPYDADYAWY